MILTIAPYAPTTDVRHAGAAYIAAHVSRLCEMFPVRVLVPDTDYNRGPIVPGPMTVYRWPVATPTGVVARCWSYARYLTGGLRPGPSIYDGLVHNQQIAADIARAKLIELHYDTSLAWLPYIRSIQRDVPVAVLSYDLYFDGLVSLLRRSKRLRPRIEAAAILARGRNREVASLQTVDLVLVFGERDRDLLVEKSLETPVSVISPFVEQLEAPLPQLGADVVFVAAFDRPQNRDGALWLRDEVWPLVREARPQARLRLVGANPSRELTEHTAAGVEVTGFLEDLKDAYAHCSVAVAPLLSGAGVKFKVAQALAYGRPVVATPVGAQGIRTPQRRGVVTVAESAPAFAASIVERLGDAWNRDIQRDAWEFAAEHFRFADSMERVGHLYAELIDRSRVM